SSSPPPPAVRRSHSRGPKPVTHPQDCGLNLHFSTSDGLFLVGRDLSKSQELFRGLEDFFYEHNSKLRISPNQPNSFGNNYK
ncbi:MAG: hypothetical protein WCK17_13160, partial [Verrucomicrobiota bacterium]